jgi:hypothetical protein
MSLSSSLRSVISGPWTARFGAAARAVGFFKSIDDESGFANHCSHCDALQDDTYLHCEPDEPFFNIPRATPGGIVLTALVGRIQLSGNEGFEV